MINSWKTNEKHVLEKDLTRFALSIIEKVQRAKLIKIIVQFGHWKHLNAMNDEWDNCIKLKSAKRSLKKTESLVLDNHL